MYKKTLLTSFVLIMTLLLGTASQAMATGGSLEVTGMAVITGAADMAEITLGVETKDESAETASQENAHLMNRVLKALKELGFTDEEITTSGYNIYSSSQVMGRGTENERTVTAYVVQNRISVTTKDLDNVGQIIDTAIKAGANQVQGIRFDIEDKQQMQLQALKNAVKQAKAKAEVIAKSAGVEISGITTINEEYGSYAPMVDTAVMRAQAFGEAKTTINPGDVEVSARVRIIFSF